MSKYEIETGCPLTVKKKEMKVSEFLKEKGVIIQNVDLKEFDKNFISKEQARKELKKKLLKGECEWICWDCNEKTGKLTWNQNKSLKELDKIIDKVLE